MTPLTPAERNALRLRTEKADEVFSGRTVGELILDVRKAHADASAGLLGASLDAILAQCIAEPFEPWPGSLVAALVAPEQLAENGSRLGGILGNSRAAYTWTGSTGTTSAPGERLPVDGDKQPRREGLDLLHRRTRSRVRLGRRPLAEHETPPASTAVGRGRSRQALHPAFNSLAATQPVGCANSIRTGAATGNLGICRRNRICAPHRVRASWLPPESPQPAESPHRLRQPPGEHGSSRRRLGVPPRDARRFVRRRAASGRRSRSTSSAPFAAISLLGSA